MSVMEKPYPTATPAAGRLLSMSPGTVLAGIVALAVGLRFALLAHNSLWFDEAWVVWLARHRWPDLLLLIRAGDAHPPLYFVVMKGWIAVAGTSEAALRIPSACCGVVTVILTYGLMRRVSSEPASLLSAWLVSVSPFAVMAGQDARMYAPLGMLAVASTLALVASVEQGGRLRWAGYVALAVLMAYTHYFAAFVLIAHGIWIAGWERRHLGTWLLGMLAAAVVYLPWLPALWAQAAHGNGWPWYRRDMFFVDVGDTLGLLSFGGSLFGMGSYFFPGTLDPRAQGLLLLPFVVIAGGGLVVLARDSRRLALVGLPFVVVGVGIAALALARFVAYPRWFSFLVPFYAMALAQGIVGIAERTETRRGVVVVVLTAGLFCFSIPVLDRYYSDPHFRPYPWRAAAGLVKAGAQPNDLLLFVNGSAGIAFSYYLPGPHPSLVLFPTESGSGSSAHPALTTAMAEQLAIRHPRVWLIATPPFSPEMQARLVPALSGAFRIVGTRSFAAIWVHLLEAKSPRGR
jgi:hypothetical protein